jgi:hypothetical protein
MTECHGNYSLRYFLRNVSFVLTAATIFTRTLTLTFGNLLCLLIGHFISIIHKRKLVKVIHLPCGGGRLRFRLYFSLFTAPSQSRQRQREKIAIYE